MVIINFFPRLIIKACVPFVDIFQNSALIMSSMIHRIITLIFTTQVKSLGDHEWNRTQQIGVLSSHPFESDTEMSDIDDDDRETIFSSMDLLSPSGHSDAQTLAMMLQEQLDAINKEIR